MTGDLFVDVVRGEAACDGGGRRGSRRVQDGRQQPVRRGLTVVHGHRRP